MNEANSSLDEALACETGKGRFQVEVSTAGTRFHADEPAEAGGLGSGPTPYQLLGAALAACTTMTLRLYAEHKNLPVRNIRTAVGHHRDPGASPVDVFVRKISFEGELTAEQRARLLAVADRCPVHGTLSSGARVDTSLGSQSPMAARAVAHVADMEALIAVGRGSFDFTE